jgi:hypothetical protein
VKKIILSVGTVAMLCFATAATGSPATDETVRIKQVWIVTYVNNSGEETIASVRAPDGSSVPMIALNAARLEDMTVTAHEIAKFKNVKLRLLKFRVREDIEDITP